MSYRVKLVGSSSDFIVHSHETILEAALRAGVVLDYACSSGTCGRCLARLVSGQVEEIKPREFVVSEAQKLQGYMLTCVNSARQDCQIEAVECVQPSDIPNQTMEVKLRKFEQLARQVYRLVVQTPRTKRLRFLAGQYVELEIDTETRCNLSIASCPCEDRLIEFHIRISPVDNFTQALMNKVRVGNQLTLTGPYGGFVYQQRSMRRIVLFAFDIGFGVMKSLLEHVTAQEQDVGIKLIWMACSDGGLYMHNLCRSWGDALDDFDYTGIVLQQSPQELITQPEQSCQMVERELLAVMNAEQDLSNCDIYVCAPEPVRQIFEKICLDKGYLSERFFSESVRGGYDLSCIDRHEQA